jgi:DNA mismatch repair protein MutH
MSATTRYAVFAIPVDSAGLIHETTSHAIDNLQDLHGITWHTVDPRLPATALINAARAAAVELRDIGGAAPHGAIFSPALIQIARNLESALKEAHDGTD